MNTKEDISMKLREIDTLVRSLDDDDADHQALMYKLDSEMDKIIRFIEFEFSWYA